MTNDQLVNSLSEISAEMLVNYLYPELRERWTVHNSGTFYRNYNRDVLSMDAETGDLQLARDGFANLLPQGLLYQTDRAEDKDNQSYIDARKRLLQDLFLPFDTFFFRRRLAIEREVSTLLDSKLKYILSTYFHIHIEEEENPYIREVAVLLPFVSHIRGDLTLVRNILASVFGCEVIFSRHKYSDTDNTRTWMPMVKYEVIMPHLTQDEYIQLTRQIEPLTRFIKEWFIPLEAECLIVVRWHDTVQETPVGHLLDYNTRLA